MLFTGNLCEVQSRGRAALWSPLLLEVFSVKFCGIFLYCLVWAVMCRVGLCWDRVELDCVVLSCAVLCWVVMCRVGLF